MNKNWNEDIAYLGLHFFFWFDDNPILQWRTQWVEKSNSGDAHSEEGWRDEENRDPRPGFFSALSCSSLPMQLEGNQLNMVVIVKIKNKWRPALKTSQPDEDSAEIQAKPYSAPFVRL